MDDAGAFRHVTARDPALEQRLHEGPTRVARRGMDDHPRRLVDNEQMRILVGDPQIARLRLQGDVPPLGGIYLQQLAAGEAVALRARLAVHPHCTAREQALGFGARGDLRQCGNEPVEPLAGSVGGNPEADRKAQRRVSPSRIAAKRMLTPTTMNVSARLKAGQ